MGFEQTSKLEVILYYAEI